MKRGIPNAIGLAKSIIGMCVDEQPYEDIQERLWELVHLLYGIRDRTAKKKKKWANLE